MNHKKMFVFEKIRVFHYPYLLYLLLRDYPVYVFNFASATGEFASPFLKRLINKRKIRHINLVLMQPHGDAIDQTEIIFNNLPQTRLRKLLATLYQSDETELIFKKHLVTTLFKCIYIHTHLLQLAKEKKKRIIFVPDQYRATRKIIRAFGSLPLPHPPDISLLNVFAAFTMVSALFQRLFLVAAGILFVLVRFIPFATRSQSPGDKRCYRYGISIGSEHYIKYKGKKGFDFLLNGQAINKNNTVFLIPYKLYSLAHIKKKVLRYEAEGYAFSVLPSDKSIQTMGNNLTRCSRFFPCRELIKAFLETPPLATECMWIFIKGCLAFVQFDTLFHAINLEKYIYSNQEGWRQIAFNIYIRSHGGTTWNYSSFIGGGLLYATNTDFRNVRHILWSFLNCDHFFAVNDHVTYYYKLHYQKIRHYHAIGSLYSEMIRNDILALNQKDFILEHFKHTGDNFKIITYFDTTFINDEIVTSFNDAIDSYQDIIKLLEEFEDVLLVIKPSKNEDWYISPSAPWSSPATGHTIIGLWNILKNHPRVFWAGDAGDVTAIIAASDLVITHCMSSPSLDALGSRKMAFWYESAQKHRGILYDQIPGLVCHGFEELRDRARQLLFQTSAADYEKYLEKYILGDLESHLDGRGLTRLRQFISC